MTNRIKILVVGDFFSPIHEDAICKAFENNNIEVPYMDTFKYINTDNGRMINYAPDKNEDGTWWLMENTNGHAQRISTEYRMDY